jgi:hypothetical protein
MKPDCIISVTYPYHSYRWSRHAACWVAGAVLYAVLEEEQRAVVEVQQYSHSTTAPQDLPLPFSAMLRAPVVHLD